MRTDRAAQSLWPLLAAALVVCASALARAHEPTSARAAVLQADEQGVAVLLSITVRGPEADLLVALYDRGRDGLDAAEAQAVALALVRKAAGDLTLTADGVGRAATKVEARLHEAAPGVSQLDASGLLSFEGVPAREVVLGVSAPRAPLLLEARARGPVRWIATSHGALDAAGAGLTAPVLLAPRSSIRLGVGRRQGG